MFLEMEFNKGWDTKISENLQNQYIHVLSKVIFTVVPLFFPLENIVIVPP